MKNISLYKALVAVFAFAATMITVSCEKEDGNLTSGQTWAPTQPQQEHFNLSGTSWIMVHDEWWTSSMHVIDTSIWHFQSDTDGIIYEHRIYNDDDPYGGQNYPMTYTFDTTTKGGVLYGYKNYDGTINPIEFAYHKEDTTLSYGEQPYIYHLIK